MDESRAFIEAVTIQWEAELRSLGVLHYDQSTLEQDHPYWLRRECALQSGTRRINDVFAGEPGDIDDTEKLFTALQDYLSTYAREALRPFEFLQDKSENPDHLFYQVPRQLIMQSLRKMTGRDQ